MHDHTHAARSQRMGWAFLLNLSFSIIEFIGGWLTNSTAIMADAVHDLGDSLSIGSGWLLDRLGNRKPDSQFTYGYRRLSLVGALVNGLVLISGSIWVISEALPRLLDPVMPHTEGMIALAVLGVTVNSFAAYKLKAGKTLNEKILNWHLMEDVFGWLAVLLVALVMPIVDMPILDPLLSVGFTLFILINVVKTVLKTGRLFIQATPNANTVDTITQSLLSLDKVESVHHLHLWSLDGEQHVLTAHIRAYPLDSLEDYSKLKETIHTALSSEDIAHTTIEIELSDERCRDE
ncbi:MULTISPECIES: cation diffusion facilitator family transporter [Spongiibacter]|uniref:cation diffusion facilitator family transporter n=1 Tax=Spongiibacter TaxID=630749 RepID=UPI000C4D0681|nr:MULTISPECIES: cation diffusion facilitator family transporter [Spongiibacter]MAY40366.1 cation transporter [Spongiibacter sp.]MBI58359.1 cation transporter [Spongiibacter sp.]